MFEPASMRLPFTTCVCECVCVCARTHERMNKHMTEAVSTHKHDSIIGKQYFTLLLIHCDKSYKNLLKKKNLHLFL